MLGLHAVSGLGVWGFHGSGFGIWNLRGYCNFDLGVWGVFPKGPCTQIVYTLAPKYLYRDYFKAKVYTIWVHGPLGGI